MKKLQCKYLLLILILSYTTNILISCDINFDKASTANFINNKSTLGIQESDTKLRVLNYNNVKDSLIRFHVIANSDTDEDQALKIKVKNAVIEYLYPYLSDSSSIEESRQIIIDNEEKVKQIAQKVIKDNTYSYDVKLELSHENFPEKSYGNIVLPQGNYEAFRIIIGSGEGRNWWCVMFPPLCFVDESKAEVQYDKTEESLTKAEKKDKVDSNNNIETSKQKIQYKFKIVEILKSLF